MLADADLGASGLSQDLIDVRSDLGDHLLVVLAERAVDVDERNAPFVHLRRVQGDAVLPARKHLAETTHAEPPRTRTVQARLVVGTNAGMRGPAAPRVPHDAALEAVAPNETLGRLGDVAVARNV